LNSPLWVTGFVPTQIPHLPGAFLFRILEHSSSLSFCRILQLDSAPNSLLEQFGTVAKKAHHTAARKEPYQLTIRDNRQLIYVLPAHDLKCPDGGSVRHDRPQLTQRPHHTLHAGLRLAVSFHTADLLSRDKPGQIIVLYYYKTPAPTGQ
jgi:hypothetical protein